MIPVKILQKMIRTISERNLFSKGDSLLLALSGGIDSTAAAHLLASIRKEWDLRLAAAHVNHQLRGEESAGDREFVERLCESLDISLAVHPGKPEESRARGVSLQSNARQIRYEFFEEERRADGIDRIITAHHRDDRVETLLLNLFRGSGARGLGGMPYRRGPIVRPLLDVTRQEIEEYMTENRYDYRVDRSNLKCSYDRNKIRLQIVPFVEETLGRSISAPLARAADVAAELDRFASGLAEEWLLTTGGAGVERFNRGIDAAAFAALPKAIGREVVRIGIESVCGALLRVSHEMVERVIDLSSGTGARRIELPGGFHAHREGKVIIFGIIPPEAPSYEFPLPLPGSVELPGGTVVRCSRGGCSREAGRHHPDRIRVDLDALSLPLLVRDHRPGDRFRPLGAPGSRKIHDLLIDRKVPRIARNVIPIVADQEGIVWLGGVEIAERAKVTGETTRLLEVAIEWAD